jgi:N-acetyl-anhydromuramyl-L-alanine amidase AmpD
MLSLFLGVCLAAPLTELERVMEQAATREGVPKPVLMAIAYEASRFDPSVVSVSEGWGMFDLHEGDQGPSLEKAAAELEVDPNLLISDWRLSVQGTAALLAAYGRLSTGGKTSPPVDDLPAWWDAVRAFSGRHEPLLQEQYTRYIFESIQQGYVVQSRWGAVVQPPIPLDLVDHGMVPPPGLDSSLASQFVQACSDNYTNDSRGSGDIDMVVIHTVQGSYSSCYNWFANCSAEASAHYVVRSSDGDITQMVPEADIAWHAGHWDTNVRSVGIEHEGYVDDPGRWYTDAMYRASAALTLDIATRQGVPLDRSHIIAHAEVPGCSSGSGGGAGCHTDPGSGWDWDYYMDLINGATNTTTGELVGVVADSDIYNGTRLVGATVWIPETGDSTTTDSSGVYHFPDLPFGTYTIHASYPGFAEGTCGPKTTSASQDWCSIALNPGEDPGPDDSAPPTDDSSPPTGDDSGVDETPGGHRPSLPGTPVVIDEVNGGCSTGSGSLFLGLLLPLFLRRKQC